MPRRRPKHEFVNQPVGRFDWERLVRSAELDPSTKYVAGWVATWASEDGGDVMMGERLLADVLGRNERFAREHLAKLRGLGLLELVAEHTRERAAEYQLTFPGGHLEPIEMRLDPYGARLSKRPAGRMGARRPVKNPGSRGSRVPVKAPDDRLPGTDSPAPGNTLTGTRVPVDNQITGTGEPVNSSDDRHSGTGEPEVTGTREHDDRHPGAASPAPGNQITGTRVPDTIQDQNKTTHDHGGPGPTAPPLAAGPGPSTAQSETESTDTGVPDVSSESFRDALAILERVPPATAEAARIQARARLAAEGVRSYRVEAVIAAHIALTATTEPGQAERT